MTSCTTSQLCGDAGADTCATTSQVSKTAARIALSVATPSKPITDLDDHVADAPVTGGPSPSKVSRTSPSNLKFASIAPGMTASASSASSREASGTTWTQAQRPVGFE